MVEVLLLFWVFAVMEQHGKNSKCGSTYGRSIADFEVFGSCCWNLFARCYLSKSCVVWFFFFNLLLLGIYAEIWWSFFLGSSIRILLFLWNFSVSGFLVGIFALVEIFALVKLWWVILGGNNFWWIRLFSFGILLFQWWKFWVEISVGWRFLFCWGFGGCFLVWEIFVGFDYYRILLIWLLSIFRIFAFCGLLGIWAFGVILVEVVPSSCCSSWVRSVWGQYLSVILCGRKVFDRNFILVSAEGFLSRCRLGNTVPRLEKRHMWVRRPSPASLLDRVLESRI